MPLIPISLQPGVYKNGTAYSGKLRWADSNLVRWKDGSIRVIGGWERRKTATGTNIAALYADATIEAPRNTFAWTDNAGVRHIVVGTNRALYYIDSSGAKSTITPAGFTPAARNSGLTVGYGTFAYGAGTYGTPRTFTGAIPTPAASWDFALWGEKLLAQFRGEGKLYEWTVGTAAALVISTSPTDMQDFLVTDERIVIGVGNSTDARIVQWSASEDNTDWTPSATNQAGSITLAGTGPLLAITQIMNELLIISQNEVYAGRYLGPPYIYGFDRVGDNNGLISPTSLVTTARFAMWAAERNFWMYDGSLHKLESDVIDFFHNDLSETEYSKTFGFSLRGFNEVWWLYQSKTSTTGEPDSYICYDFSGNHWTKGKIGRGVAVDNAATAYPLMVSADGLLYNHELPGTAITDGVIPYCETGPLELGQGDRQAFIDYLYPDEAVAGDVTLTILTQDMPNLPALSFGPYNLTGPTPVRARGRQFALRFEGRAAGWQIGTMRVNVKTGGIR
jgi:hypothetical protein